MTGGKQAYPNSNFCAKQKYDTPHEVRTVLRRVRRAIKLAGKADVYKCPVCDKWHWGHARS